MNNNIDPILDKVKSDILIKEDQTLSSKIEFQFEEDKKNTFINDDKNDITTRIDFGEIDKEKAYEMAEAVYQSAKVVSSSSSTSKINATNKNDDGLSSSSTDENKQPTTVDALLERVGNMVDVIGEGVNDLSQAISNIFSQEGMEGFAGTMGSILDGISDSISNYKDGISETSYGEAQEESWAHQSSMSFLNYFASQGVNSKVSFTQKTPLDPGDSSSAIYGSMVLGTPFLFNEIADPTNRTLINSFVKDSRILSLTPGKPKFNGLMSYGEVSKSSLNQNSNPDEMLNYLTRNGLNSSFSSKDRRYYTFETEYNDYFAYLETMLNATWIKLGLADTGDGKFNLFSFFKVKNNNGIIDPSGADALKDQYQSSIGFYTNPVGVLSESIDSQTTSIGADLASNANANAQDYQKLNYITGMGKKNFSRKVGIGTNIVSQVKGLIGETFQSTASAISTADFGDIASGILSGVGIAAGVVSDITRFNSTQDLGAIIQSFSVSNGMTVMYPELWANSAYSKNVNINFTFTSPYGDPLSIFKYVYVPFLALSCFAMPKQAAENGQVSPFLVRADIPGLFTSDLALITSITWTKGGSAGLWTKDGLPRSIDCSITITDLYPYLTMTKRISFLSANPSYTVFLDNLSGMCALHEASTDDEDPLNLYFKDMINRVNGKHENNMWNKFNSKKKRVNDDFANRLQRYSISGRISRYNIPWLHNSSIY